MVLQKNTIKKVYLMPFTVTAKVKMIMYQYEVIHNVLPTSVTLCQDGISEKNRIQLMQHRRTNVASPTHNKCKYVLHTLMTRFSIDSYGERISMTFPLCTSDSD